MEKCYKPDITSKLNNFTIAVIKEPVFEINKSRSKSRNGWKLEIIWLQLSSTHQWKIKSNYNKNPKTAETWSITYPQPCDANLKTAPLQGSSRLMSSLPRWFPDARILAGVQQFRRFFLGPPDPQLYYCILLLQFTFWMVKLFFNVEHFPIKTGEMGSHLSTWLGRIWHHRDDILAGM